MLKKITLGIILLTTVAFGKINDYRKVFSPEETVKINEAITNFQSKTGNTLFLNTLEDQEGFQSEEQEKVVIVNMIKNDGGDIKIQIQLSYDLDPEEMAPEISLLLNNIEDSVKAKNEVVVSEKIVDGLNQIFSIEKEELEPQEPETLSLGVKIFLGVLLTIFVLCIRIIQVKRKKKKYKFKRR